MFAYRNLHDMNNINEAKCCALCKKNPQKEISHIIPKFIVRKLLKIGDSGVFRCAENPNVRKQDAIKCQMLCPSCEDLFSLFEKHFAETYFHPSLEKALPDDIGKNDVTALKFLASMSFRGIWYFLHKNIASDDLITTYSSTLDILGDFLLSKTSSTLPLYHELYYVVDSNVHERIHTNQTLHYYLNSGIDIDYLKYLDGGLQYVIKFGPFISVLTIRKSALYVPPKSPICDNGFYTYSLPLNELPESIHKFIMDAVEMTKQSMAKISTKQQNIIKKNWECFQRNKPTQN